MLPAKDWAHGVIESDQSGSTRDTVLLFPAVTNCRKLVASSNQNVFRHNPGGQKSEVELLAILPQEALGEKPFLRLWLLMDAGIPCALMTPCSARIFTSPSLLSVSAPLLSVSNLPLSFSYKDTCRWILGLPGNPG